MQLSGNKVRKLEFLLADALAQGADCVVTIGGIQSNHCRATAVAARYLNLDCYLILRTSKVHGYFAFCLLISFHCKWLVSFAMTSFRLQVNTDEDPGLTGNLLVERLVGAHIDLVSKEDYANVGAVVYQLSFLCHLCLAVSCVVQVFLEDFFDLNMYDNRY